MRIHLQQPEAGLDNRPTHQARDRSQLGADLCSRHPDGVPVGNVHQRAFRRDQVPGDMVGVVAFLLSPDSSFITGQNFYVNGGRWFS